MGLACPTDQRQRLCARRWSGRFPCAVNLVRRNCGACEWSPVWPRWDKQGVGDDRLGFSDDERVDVERFDSLPDGQPEGVEPHDRFCYNIKPDGWAAPRPLQLPI